MTIIVAPMIKFRATNVPNLVSSEAVVVVIILENRLEAQRESKLRREVKMKSFSTLTQILDDTKRDQRFCFSTVELLMVKF